MFIVLILCLLPRGFVLTFLLTASFYSMCGGFEPACSACAVGEAGEGGREEE